MSTVSETYLILNSCIIGISSVKIKKMFNIETISIPAPPVKPPKGLFNIGSRFRYRCAHKSSIFLEFPTSPSHCPMLSRPVVYLTALSSIHTLSRFRSRENKSGECDFDHHFRITYDATLVIAFFHYFIKKIVPIFYFSHSLKAKFRMSFTNY